MPVTSFTAPEIVDYGTLVDVTAASALDGAIHFAQIGPSLSGAATPTPGATATPTPGGETPTATPTPGPGQGGVLPGTDSGGGTTPGTDAPAPSGGGTTPPAPSGTATPTATPVQDVLGDTQSGGATQTPLPTPSGTGTSTPGGNPIEGVNGTTDSGGGNPGTPGGSPAAAGVTADLSAGSDGRLPFTGAEVGLVASVGAAMAATGAALRRATRRDDA